MPERDPSIVGAPCWIDLMTSDPEKSKAFYGELFGWKAEEAGPEYGNYITFTKDDKPVAGGMRNEPGSGMPDLWSVYLAVEDAEVTADAAAAHGGNVTMAPMEVPEMGNFAVVSDIGGAAIGMWQPKPFEGFGVLGESGTPGWFELHTRDYDATVQFYRDVFGWDTHVVGDSPEFRYTTLGEGDSRQAGIMDAAGFLPDGVPAHWSVYFRVDDTDAALAKIGELGGAVVMPAEDTPYGRLASATDSTGSLFKLVVDS